MEKYDFYLAAPFFNKEQVERVKLVEDLADVYGLNVFSPRHFGELEPTASAEEQKLVFEGDIKAIDNLFLMWHEQNGRVLRKE